MSQKKSLKRATQHQTNQIISMKTSGYSNKEISSEVGLSVDRVKRIIRYRKVSFDKYQAGFYTMQELADLTGISKRTLNYKASLEQLDTVVMNGFTGKPGAFILIVKQK